MTAPTPAPLNAPPPPVPRPEDRAVVVGVSHYPGGFPELQGPVRDAEDFRDWLIAPTGGGLAPGQVRLLTTPNPPPINVGAACPLDADVRKAFDELEDLALANNATNGPLRAGRRLYLFFSGHGFAPAAVVRRFETAVLMANATRTRLGYHIPARGYADWFHASGYFDEILLFMDCCREVFRTAPVAGPHFADPAGGRPVRGFYAFGTKWKGLARERHFDDVGQTRGVFTRALMAGLRGAARDAAGNVTTTSLRDYLFTNMQTFLAPADLANRDIPKEPDFDTMPEVNGDFVIASYSPPTATLRVSIPPTVTQVKLIVDGVAAGPAPESTIAKAVFRVAPGRHLVVWNDGGRVETRQVTLVMGGDHREQL